MKQTCCLFENEMNFQKISFAYKFSRIENKLICWFQAKNIMASENYHLDVYMNLSTLLPIPFIHSPFL